MDRDRVAEIHNPHANSGGTGYLIQENLILTAYHVINPYKEKEISTSAYDIRFIRDLRAERTAWRTAGAGLCWVAPTLDLALLKLKEDESTFLPECNSIQFGKLGDETLDAQGLGFPVVQKIGKYQNPEPVEGKVSRMAGLRENQLRLQVLSPIPSAPEQWAGISGTALFVKNYLVGVITETNKSFGEKALWAVPISLVANDREFCGLVLDDHNRALTLIDVESTPLRSSRKEPHVSEQEIALMVAYEMSGRTWQSFSEEEFKFRLRQRLDSTSEVLSQIIAVLKHKNILEAISSSTDYIKFTPKGQRHYRQQNYQD